VLEANTVFFSRKGLKGTETLETACTKRVREACENITLFLKCLLEDLADEDKINKEIVWREVGKAVTYNQPVEVVSSLQLIAEETAEKLHGQANAINLIEDAKSLRFKYASSGHLKDMSTTPDVMCSVNQIILVIACLFLLKL
ncbi:uncharacterized protein LOC117120069, partial [Anneissia japonica]|uniref:uncharacterized protein LOC117120069 n=1 Tax=Anneissia japonica TaxID=1529436 RepID=UPI00142553D0